MGILKYTLLHEGGYEEPQSVTLDNYMPSEEHGKLLLDRFNNTLRPGEKPRVFAGTKDESWQEGFTDHKFTKKNLVTLRDGGRMYDEYTCERCGLYAWSYNLQRSYEVYKKDEPYLKDCDGYKNKNK